MHFEAVENHHNIFRVSEADEFDCRKVCVSYQSFFKAGDYRKASVEPLG